MGADQDVVDAVAVDVAGPANGFARLTGTVDAINDKSIAASER